MLLAREDIARREAYRELLNAHLDEEQIEQIRQATNGNYALGSARFQAQIAKALGQRVVRGKAGRPVTNADGASGELEFG